MPTNTTNKARRDRQARSKNESKLNARYAEIRNVAYRLMDDAYADNSLYENQNWRNERFELNTEYVGICEELKGLGYVELEAFPGNEE